MTNMILDIGAVSAGGLLSLLEVCHGVLRWTSTSSELFSDIPAMPCGKSALRWVNFFESELCLRAIYRARTYVAHVWYWRFSMKCRDQVWGQNASQTIYCSTINDATVSLFRHSFEHCLAILLIVMDFCSSFQMGPSNRFFQASGSSLGPRACDRGSQVEGVNVAQSLHR